MNKIFKLTFNIIGFKLTWIACIIGEIYFNSWIGFFVGIIYLLLFFLFQINRTRSLYIIIIFSSAGYIFDSLISLFSFYKINSEINFLFLPIWFIVLWPSFATLLIETLSFLKKKYLLSIFFGGIGGPTTYYFAAKTDLAIVNNYYLTFIPMIFFWSFLMFFYSHYYEIKNSQN